MDWTTGFLTIVAQQGFDDEFLSFFRVVTVRDGCACGRAARERQPIVIKDVLHDPAFEPYRKAAIASGFRAVHSTPLISTSGAFVGMVSTHFPAPHIPTERELSAVRSAGELTANAIIGFRSRSRRFGQLGLAGEAVAKSEEALARSYATLRWSAILQKYPGSPAFTP
jgi:GAF domain-containing protein